jgi:hypothetical protein
MIEVILSLGVISVAIISLLGLLGPTLTAVTTVNSTNAAISAVSELNVILNSAPFYNGSTGSSEDQSVYTWVQESTSAKPVVFLFYQVVSNVTTINPGTQLQVCVYPSNSTVVVPDPAHSTATTVVPYPDYSLMQADAEASPGAGRTIQGPIIAMAISLSPLAAGFPEGNFYTPPSSGSLFPSGALLPLPPNTAAAVAYYETYVPILVQVFSLSPDKYAAGTQFSLADLNQTNLLFSYTTAKLR